MALLNLLKKYVMECLYLSCLKNVNVLWSDSCTEDLMFTMHPLVQYPVECAKDPVIWELFLAC